MTGLLPFVERLFDVNVAGVAAASGSGIGMRNVRERMDVQYGSLASVEINSRPGRGTKVTLRMPVLEAGAAAWPQSGREVLAAATDVMGDVMRRVTRAGG